MCYDVITLTKRIPKKKNSNLVGEGGLDSRSNIGHFKDEEFSKGKHI